MAPVACMFFFASPTRIHRKVFMMFFFIVHQQFWRWTGLSCLQFVCLPAFLTSVYLLFWQDKSCEHDGHNKATFFWPSAPFLWRQSMSDRGPVELLFWIASTGRQSPKREQASSVFFAERWDEPALCRVAQTGLLPTITNCLRPLYMSV